MESIFSDILKEVVTKKVCQKIERSILCNLAIEKSISHLFEDSYTEGIDEHLRHIAEKEQKIDFKTDLVVDSVLDNIINTTSLDVAEKRVAVRHLFLEPLPSHFISQPSTPGSVLVQ